MASSSSASNHLQRMPSSIAELAQKARNNPLRENQSLKYYLKHAESNRREAFKFAEAGDLESAFIFFARTASLVLETLPSHPDYKTALDDNQRANLNMNRQEIIDNLGQLKTRISDRYEAYRRDHPEAEESHQRALQAQIEYEGSQSIQLPSVPDDRERKDKALQEVQDRATKLSDELVQLHMNDPNLRARANIPFATEKAIESAREQLGVREKGRLILSHRHRGIRTKYCGNALLGLLLSKVQSPRLLRRVHLLMFLCQPHQGARRTRLTIQRRDTTPLRHRHLSVCLLHPQL
ncbi:hypothetical protein E1B28_006736 [Marasmius oreades]|uniref:USP8 dimerisation domain-containing protein n=1 Tax=Marasmius oreades TaxID=181124 RepID=A0A9P7UWQ6_9AGAR|nr:uncharacterized protein E1B28_006736 [Marasmius oreades]KAG7096055.1 hypothetical protein E1B28_006736 [Marasmius oreades]